jgi:vanillate O-demethylase monooxygenase subunit
MYHGFLFDTDGKVVKIPGQDQVPDTARVRKYPVVDQDSWIWVWMGDRDLADASLIPRVFGIDHPDWLLRHGQLDYAAEARLINDNLTDFSHLAFVHAGSFAANADFATAKTTVTPLSNGVRIERWAENQPPLGQPDSELVFDVYLTYDYLVPGILSLITKLYPPGTFARIGQINPELGLEILHMYSGQAVTPTGHKSTRYFFTNGSHQPADPAQVEELWTITLQAFAEDNVMIEGQQRIIDLDPARRIMPAIGDKGTVLYNRLVDRLVREEHTAAAAE